MREKNTGLSEQSQNQIPDCRNNPKIKYQTVGTMPKSNTRLSEQSQNQIPDRRNNPKIKYQTVGKIPKSNTRLGTIPKSNIMTAHFYGLVEAFQYNVMGLNWLYGPNPYDINN